MTTNKNSNPTHNLQCHYSVKNWNELPAAESEHTKLNRVCAEYEYRGELEGKSTVLLSIYYYPAGLAEFTGIEQIQGTINDQPSQLVLVHSGVFNQGVAEGKCRAIDSNQSSLIGLAGHYRADSTEVQFNLRSTSLSNC